MVIFVLIGLNNIKAINKGVLAADTTASIISVIRISRSHFLWVHQKELVWKIEYDGKSSVLNLSMAWDSLGHHLSTRMVRVETSKVNIVLLISPFPQ